MNKTLRKMQVLTYRTEREQAKLKHWKVIDGTTGRLAVVDIPNPSRPILFASDHKVDCLNFVHRHETNVRQAQQLAHGIIYACGVLAILWGLLWASGAYAADFSVQWQAPTQNTDGTPLTDLAGYRVYVGATSRQYTDQVTLSDPTATSATVSMPIDWLVEGDNMVFVAMTALDGAGNESAYSNEVQKLITVADTTAPNPPNTITITITLTTDCPAGFTCNVEVTP